MALNVNCKFGNLCCHSFQNLKGVCIKPIGLAIKCVSTVKRKNTKCRSLRTNVEKNILPSERDGTCTVLGAVRSAHKITKSVEQIPSWEANRSSASPEIPHFYGTGRFITAFTRARHLSLFWTKAIHSMFLQPISWKSSQILFCRLRLILPSRLLPSDLLPLIVATQKTITVV